MKRFCAIFLFLLTLNGFSQNEPQFTQIAGNEQHFNPAAITSKLEIDNVLLTRQQWYGFDGSPRTILLNSGTYLQPLHGGVGISAYADKLGYESSVKLMALYSYQREIFNGIQLNLGLGVGMINKSIDGTKLRYEDQTDEFALYSGYSTFKPDFSFGAEVHSTQGYSFGLSAVHLDRSVKGATLGSNPRHYYFYGSYAIKADENIQVVPYLLVKSTLYTTNWELNTNAYFDQDLWWAGFTYRSSSAISFQAGINLEKAAIVDEQIRLGYAYDYGIGGINSHSGGSHEIMLVIKIDGAKRRRIKVLSPRDGFSTS